MPTHMIQKVSVPLLHKDYKWPGWDKFRDLITRDMANLNKAAISARTQAERVNFETWAGDGKLYHCH